ncbi:MAG: class I SAM-dependent methyltransferase family protein [Archaeoglobales archaeon]|nr:class I SAM-dependent methyltransferase family protein [Archaeoglobales archaeon]
MKAVRVRKENAEEVRRLAERIGAKDRRRLIKTDGEYVEIPILDGFEQNFRDFEIVDQEIPVENPRRKFPELVSEKVPASVRNFLPTSYKIIGDIAIVKLREEVEEYAKEIANSIMASNPRIKSVWRDLGREGMIRRPKLELLAGNGSETIHVENGCMFKLDVTKVMFSLGNQHERQRIAEKTDGEVVVDMFAGIGYFTIPAAKRAEKVYAIELNPEAYGYLLENIRLNKLRNVLPVLGDSMFVTPESVADRVIMGHIFCQDFLETAIRAIDRRGFVHYHESTPIKVLERPVLRVQRACRKLGRECKIVEFRKVKNYAPGVAHVVVDALVYKNGCPENPEL